MREPTIKDWEPKAHPPAKKRGRKDRPYIIESRFRSIRIPAFREWRNWQRYKTAEQRDQALAKLRKNHTGMEFRAADPHHPT